MRKPTTALYTRRRPIGFMWGMPLVIVGWLFSSRYPLFTHIYTDVSGGRRSLWNW